MTKGQKRDKGFNFVLLDNFFRYVFLGCQKKNFNVFFVNVFAAFGTSPMPHGIRFFVNLFTSF